MFSDLDHLVYSVLAEVIQVKMLVALICVLVLWVLNSRFTQDMLKSCTSLFVLVAQLVAFFGLAS